MANFLPGIGQLQSQFAQNTAGLQVNQGNRERAVRLMQLNSTVNRILADNARKKEKARESTAKQQQAVTAIGAILGGAFLAPAAGAAPAAGGGGVGAGAAGSAGTKSRPGTGGGGGGGQDSGTAGVGGIGGAPGGAGGGGGGGTSVGGAGGAGALGRVRIFTFM